MGMGSVNAVAAIGSDPDALEEFYREHVEAVQRMVARRVDDPYLAADLTTDVFLAAVDSAESYRSELGPPRAWLVGVTRNVLAMHVRRAVRESRALGRARGRRPLEQDYIQQAIERIDAERATRSTFEAVRGLEEGQRAVLELVLDGLTPSEAAAVLGITSAAARVRLHRARRHLTESSRTSADLVPLLPEVIP
jgi:RNA polymerase sigma factor (sigma-70 family)